MAKYFKRVGGQRSYVHGLQEINDKLLAYGRKAGVKTLEKGLIEIAEPIVSDMKANAPVDDGDLRDAIDYGKKLTKSQNKKFRSAAIWKRKRALGLDKGPRAKRRLRKDETQNLIDTAVIHVGVSQTGSKLGTPKGETVADPNQYAHIIEFGKHDAPAQPFARPAWDKNAQSAVAKFTSFMKRELGL